MTLGGGSEWESNPPRPATRPATGFEDQGTHRGTITPKDRKQEKHAFLRRNEAPHGGISVRSDERGDYTFKLRKQSSGLDFRNGVRAVAVQAGGASFAGSHVGRRLNNPRFEDAAAEVTFVEFFAQDDFIGGLEFR